MASTLNIYQEKSGKNNYSHANLMHYNSIKKLFTVLWCLIPVRILTNESTVSESSSITVNNTFLKLEKCESTSIINLSKEYCPRLSRPSLAQCTPAILISLERYGYRLLLECRTESQKRNGNVNCSYYCLLRI